MDSLRILWSAFSPESQVFLVRRDHIASLKLGKMLKIVSQAHALACIIREPLNLSI